MQSVRRLLIPMKDFSYNIHTVRDDMDQQGQYNFGHMLEFVKLVRCSHCIQQAYVNSRHHQGIAFIAELAARQ